MTEHYRVLGPPGTGKTHYLARQIERALRVNTPDEIAVASFTSAASYEIARRAGLRDNPNVGTLHALAFRLLDRPEIAESKLDDWNRYVTATHGARFAVSSSHAVKARKTEAVEGDDPDAPPADLEHTNGSDDVESPTDVQRSGDKLFVDAQLLRARSLSRDDLNDRLDRAPVDVRRFYAAWTDWMRDNDLMDFQGLIETCRDDHVYLPRTVTKGFFDEAQDFTAAEFALTQMWATRIATTVWVGDDDQCIYAFKGARPETLIGPWATMTEAEREAAMGQSYRVLGQSYRVPKAVLDMAVEWVSKVRARLPKKYAPRVDENGTAVEGEVLKTAGSLAEQTKWLKIVEREVTAGRSVMLLASCGFHARKIGAALKEAGIGYWNPYAPGRGEFNPLGRTDKWRRAKGTDTRALAERIRAMRGGRNTAMDRVLAFVLPMMEGSESWTWGDVELWASVLGSSRKANEYTAPLARGAKSWIEKEANKDATALGLDTIFEPDFFRDVIETGDLALWAKAAAEARNEAVMYPAKIAARFGATALVEHPLVTVGTIHSVKGGEADTVIVFPDLSAKGAVEWASPLTRDPLIRLFYVAFTRAREKLILARASTPMSVWQ